VHSAPKLTDHPECFHAVKKHRRRRPVSGSNTNKDTGQINLQQGSSRLGLKKNSLYSRIVVEKHTLIIHNRNLKIGSLKKLQKLVFDDKFFFSFHLKKIRKKIE